MIIRIVKMTFREDSSETFKDFTNTIKNKIQNFEGCLHLDIFRDIKNPNIFFTYSHWDTEEHLNKYRYSDFFKSTWAKTKQWFDDKPCAWSVENVSG